jgi:hypothetical protein
MRVLLCTFGFDSDKIVRAMRSIKHDRLVLITGSDNLEHDSFARIQRLCGQLGTPLELVITDKFDLLASMAAVHGKVERLLAEHHEVRIDVGGGVPVLSMAALITAMNLGVEAWHVDRNTIKLPVLAGVSIVSRLSTEQRSIIAQIGPGVRMDRIKLNGSTREDVKRVLLALKRSGMIRVESALPDAMVNLTSEGELCRLSMMRGLTKARPITV